jgi:hypothetical protein
MTAAVLIDPRNEGKGVTRVMLEHRDVPAQLAGAVQPFWDWSLQRGLPIFLTRVPWDGYPWDRGPA